MTAAMSSSTSSATLPSASASLLSAHHEPHGLVQVAFDYEYDYKTRKISVRQGEKLLLLQKTNQHWWKCMRPGVNKAFFVPAQYVNMLDESGDTESRSDGDDKKFPFPLKRGNASINNKSDVQKSSSSVDSTNTDSEVVRPKPRKSIFSTFERLKEGKLSSTSSKPVVPSKSKAGIINSRNETSRASCRSVTKEKSVHLGASNNNDSGSSRNNHRHSERKSSSGSSSLRLKNWSASLEELSKQIVFPGLTSESVVDLTSLSANNSFKPSSIAESNRKLRQRCEEAGNEEKNSQTCKSNRLSSSHNHPYKTNEQQTNTSTNTANTVTATSDASSSEKRHPSGATGGNDNLSESCEPTLATINKCFTLRNSTFSNNNNEEKGSPANLPNSYTSREQNNATIHHQHNSCTSQPDSPKEAHESSAHAGSVATDVLMKSKDNCDGSLDTSGSSRGEGNNGNSGTSLVGVSTPIPKGPPSRVLADNWEEYFSPEKNRYFYYNTEEKKTSWKPPRSSSNNRRSDECLATSSSAGRSGASTLGSSIENSLDNLYEEINNSIMMDVRGSRNSIIGSGSIISTGTHTKLPNKPDILQIPSSVGSSRKSVAAMSNEELSLEEKLSRPNSIVKKKSDAQYGGSSSSVFDSQENLDTNSPHYQAQEEEFSFSNLSASIPIPDGWGECWDESTQQLYYVNKVTGAKWFTSTDPQGKIYFYEENSSQSSWFLPENQVAPSEDTQDVSLKPSNDSLSIQTDEPAKKLVSNSVSNAEELLSFGSVKKRHSAGDAIDRSAKSKSLFLERDATLSRSHHPNSNSLPRSTSIWSSGQVNERSIKRKGALCRTKITESGKKVRKNWGVVFAVLTDYHLSLFKDQKSFTAQKSELEIELDGSTAEWTDEKSSRKNVFQLNTRSDLQMLFQSEDKNLAIEWFEDIKRISESNVPVDISMRLRSTECPETLLDPTIGERKISSRLYRNKSTKLKITPSTEDMGADRKKITANLKKFFSRRPPRESLVKKGIYKDEPVFGCSLEKLCMLEKRTVPRFVEECILAIEQKEENLKTDGIYRASGNLSQVQKIRLQVDQNYFQCLYQEEDVHVLAGSLKLFFREMREPLISYDLFEKSFEAINSQKKDKVSKFRDIVKNLAKPNRDTLQALLRHLLKVAELAEYNRMQIPNLAIVFGPTLMWPAIESKNMALDLMQQNYVIEALLVEYESLFQ